MRMAENNMLNSVDASTQPSLTQFVTGVILDPCKHQVRHHGTTMRRDGQSNVMVFKIAYDQMRP